MQDEEKLVAVSLVCQVGLGIVSFTNPLASGSEAGNLSKWSSASLIPIPARDIGLANHALLLLD